MTADKIVGAAALAAAVFLESTAPEIEEQLDGCKLHAPSLLRFEMANVCVRKIRKYPHERDRILARSWAEGWRGEKRIQWPTVPRIWPIMP